MLALNLPARWTLPELDSYLYYPPYFITFSLDPHALCTASIETTVFILKGEHQEIDPQAPHWSVGKSSSLTAGDDETPLTESTTFIQHSKYFQVSYLKWSHIRDEHSLIVTLNMLEFNYNTQ